MVPATRRSSLGDRAFVVAGPHAWNSLPEFVTDCSSPLTFKKHLKTYLFSLSFRARFYCPCSSLGRLRRSNFVTLHYITSICCGFVIGPYNKLYIKSSTTNLQQFECCIQQIHHSLTLTHSRRRLAIQSRANYVMIMLCYKFVYRLQWRPN